MSSAAESIEKNLAVATDPRSGLQAAVETLADAFAARTVTLHRADPETRFLHLVAQVGLPEKMTPVIGKIPYGKGMAGICIERLEVVTVCNIQTDTTGAAKPGAKETGVAGAIVFPVFGKGGVCIGTLGVGKSSEYEYPESEKSALAECAARIAKGLARL